MKYVKGKEKDLSKFPRERKPGPKARHESARQLTPDAVHYYLYPVYCRAHEKYRPAYTFEGRRGASLGASRRPNGDGAATTRGAEASRWSSCLLLLLPDGAQALEDVFEERNKEGRGKILGGAAQGSSG